MTDNNPMMGPKDAAAYLRLNEQTVRRLARERRIPAIRIGGSWRFNREDLARWSAGGDASPGRPGDPAPRPGRILVVDDDGAVLDLVRRTLERQGFEIATATGGTEALRMIAERRPDLVLLDLFMNDMDGTEVLAHIRAEWGFLPVAIMTAFPESALMQKALMLSPVLLLSKPFTRAQLLAAVRHPLPSAPAADEVAVACGAGTRE